MLVIVLFVDEVFYFVIIVLLFFYRIFKSFFIVFIEFINRLVRYFLI